MLVLMATLTLWWDAPDNSPLWHTLPHIYPEVYQTLDEAGIDAVEHAYDHSAFYEYGGVILRQADGTFRVGVPETNYRGDGVHIDHGTDDWPDTTIVADYHTHPCMPYTHYVAIFSDNDVKSNDNTAHIGYLGDLCSGVVRRFVPGVTKEDYCFEAGDEQCGSRGEVVGKIQITRKPIIIEMVNPTMKKQGKISW